MIWWRLSRLGLAACLVGYVWVGVKSGTGIAADSASAVAWSEEAERNPAQARYCLRRAVELGPRIPTVLMRAVNYHFAEGDGAEVLRLAGRTVELTGEYDGILMSYTEQFGFRVAEVMDALRVSRRACQGYQRHVMASGDAARAGEGWERLQRFGYADEGSAGEYVAFLMQQRRYRESVRVWEEQTGERRGANALFNGGFERALGGPGFAWQVQKLAGVEVDRDSGAHGGAYALRVSFGGTANVSFAGVTQRAVVAPGRHVLTAWVKSAGITTNEAPHLHVWPVNAKSEGLSGTREWQRVRVEFDVPAGVDVVTVGVCREASMKIESKIAGVVWVDEVELR